MISVTVTDRSGRTLSGQTIDAFWVSIAHASRSASASTARSAARDMRPYLAELARIADCYVSCYPNAGLPNAFGEYDEQADRHGGYLREFAESGFVNIVGGCCGTTPDAHRGDRLGRPVAVGPAVRPGLGADRAAWSAEPPRARSPNSPASRP